MFDDWYFYLLVICVSFCMQFLFRLELGPFRMILNVLGFVGVLVHELSHYILCKVTGVKVEGLTIRYRSRISGKGNPHGFVTLEEHESSSFLQILLVAIAPLFIHTWLIMLCFELLHVPGFDDLVYIAIGLVVVSLFIGSAPSNPDLQHCGKAFGRSPAYSVYQLLLLGISIITVLCTFQIIALEFTMLPFEFLIYIIQYLLVALGYFFYKYFFRGINNFLHSKHHTNRVNLRLITRKRHRPIKPRKLGIKEPHW